MLLVAVLLEHFLLEVNPIVWCVGLATGLVFGIMGNGLVTLKESLIAFVVTFIFVFIVYMCFPGALGGGLIKGACVCGFFLGRYVIIDIILFFILMIIVSKIINLKKKDRLPGESKINAILYLMISTIIALVAMYFLGKI